MEEPDKRGQETRDRITKALQAAFLASAKQQQYQEAIDVLVNAMTPQAQQRLSASVKEVLFYETHGQLTAAVHSKYPTLQVRGVLKGCFDRNGTLHLNGGGMLFGREAPLAEFYAHEMSHAIDGNNHEISNSAAWRKAWETEKHFLSDNGRSIPSEGFAEFGQMIYATEITRKQMRQVMPQCLKVWEDHGL